MRELPTGWCTASLAAVADVVRGVTYKKADASGAPVDGYLPILRATNIDGGLRLDSEMVYVPDRYVRADQRMQRGDILVAASSGSASVVGKSAELRQDWDGGFGAFCSVIRPSPLLAGAYLAHFVASPDVRRAWRALAQGTNINNLKASDIANTEIPIAPLEEQERIVRALEEEFSRLDAGVAALDRARGNLSRMEAAVLQAAVLGRLVRQDPADGDAADEVAELPKRSRFTKDMPRPVLKEYELPENWTTAYLEDLADRVTVGFVGPMQREYVADGVPFLRSQNVRANRFDPDGLKFIGAGFHERIIKSKLLPGDVVIVRSGDVGTACVIPESLGEANCSDLVVIQRPQGIDPRFVAYYMNSIGQRYVRAGRVGVALTHFNTKSVAALPMPIPPMREQERIVAEAERYLSILGDLKGIVRRVAARTPQARSSILSAAFGGRLVPQGPNNEPASALLKQIATERAESGGGNATPKRARRRRVAA